MILLQSCQQQLQEYSSLRQQPDAGALSTMVCDRCLQAIDEATFHSNVARLKQLAHAAADAYLEQSNLLTDKRVRHCLGGASCTEVPVKVKRSMQILVG